MFVSQAQAQTHDAAPAHGAGASHGGAVVTHTEVHAADEAHEGGFPPMESTYYPSQVLWLAITFGLFYLVLKRVILPRIGGIVDNRRDRIGLDLQAAERMKADADESRAAYEQGLAAARERSQKIAVEARDAAKAAAEAERAKTEAELAAKLDAAQARIGDIKREALADVGTIAEEAAEAVLASVAGLDVPRGEVADAVRSVRAQG